mmetsp:Transcript_102742/g.182520  ORF Transcript_102742/g.182520 Transcript_102742/m.182520 type:complete len:130 (+) Transcript_102742:2433-2822(+)
MGKTHPCTAQRRQIVLAEFAPRDADPSVAAEAWGGRSPENDDHRDEWFLEVHPLHAAEAEGSKLPALHRYKALYPNSADQPSLMALSCKRTDATSGVASQLAEDVKATALPVLSDAALPPGSHSKVSEP